jgi:SWI/SNF-related matrix-associated actin-dependent regulator of chromatin subfamily A3
VIQAFAALPADRRWIATGTPIVNSPSDLGSLLTCLRVWKPLDQAQYFKSLLLRPLKTGQPQAGKLLQALVGQVLLRRTKDSKDASGRSLVSLPSIEYFQVPVPLDQETRTLYDELHEISRNKFQEALRTGQVGDNSGIKVTRCVC